MTGTVRYLSEEWFAAVNQALAGDAGTAEATAELSISIQQVVTGGPDGDVAYVVAIDRGQVEFRPGRAETPHVTLTTDYRTALALHQGRITTPDAFVRGRIRVGGDVAALVAAAGPLARLDAAFAAVRDRTD